MALMNRAMNAARRSDDMLSAVHDASELLVLDVGLHSHPHDGLVPIVGEVVPIDCGQLALGTFAGGAGTELLVGTARPNVMDRPHDMLSVRAIVLERTSRRAATTTRWRGTPSLSSSSCAEFKLKNRHVLFSGASVALRRTRGGDFVGDAGKAKNILSGGKGTVMITKHSPSVLK